MRLLCYVILIFSMNQVFSQQPVTWNTLEETTYEYTQQPGQFDFVGAPVFSDDVKALDGKKISIQGYLIPLDVDGWVWALSAYSFSSCFFCGGAGKESVISLQLKKSLSSSTNEVREFVGILRLQNDPNGLTYILENAKPVN